VIIRKVPHPQHRMVIAKNLPRGDCCYQRFLIERPLRSHRGELTGESVLDVAQRPRSAAVTPHSADLEVLDQATGGVTVGCISWLGGDGSVSLLLIEPHE